MPTTNFFARSRLLLTALSVAAVGVVVAAVMTGTGKVELTIPAGTRMIAALDQTVSTKSSDVGQRIELTTVDPIRLKDGHVVPEGVTIRGEVTHSKDGGRIAGAPELTLRFTEMEVSGEEYAIRADPFRVRGKSDLGESAAEIGGGAVVGGVIGALTGHPVRGAAVGAVLGTGVAVATDGDDIVLPAGQRLRLRLAESVTVEVPRGEAKAKES
jgi:hypothetical protein